MMNEFIHVKSYSSPTTDRREILRYSGVRGEVTEEISKLLDECLECVKDKLNFKLCYKRFSISVGDGIVDLGFAKTGSTSLRKHLDGCDKIILFAATVGIEIDRLMARYAAVSPAKSHMLQAIGAERIEALCDAFEDELRENGLDISSRFSPGYGDLPIELQTEIFAALECQKNIGISLNKSFLMTPTKSVTAIMGIKKKEEENEDK